MAKHCPACGNEFVGLERYCSPRCEARGVTEPAVTESVPVTKDSVTKVVDRDSVTEDNVTVRPVGRPRVYDSNAERQRAYRERKKRRVTE